MQRNQRLRRAGFAETYHGGQAWSSPLLVLRARPNGGASSRFGFAVGKRIGKAVVRNRIRRRLRAIARELPIASGWDIVVVARGPAAGGSYEQLRAAFAHLVGRAGLGESRTEGEQRQ